MLRVRPGPTRRGSDRQDASQGWPIRRTVSPTRRDLSTTQPKHRADDVTNKLVCPKIPEGIQCDDDPVGKEGPPAPPSGLDGGREGGGVVAMCHCDGQRGSVATLAL